MSTPASRSTQPPNPPPDPATEELRKRLIEETLRRTKGEKSPHDWQLKVALDMLAGHDTLTIAGTGSGKTLPFVMPAFVLEKAIIWILAPLNYIQEQQVTDFEGMGLSAVCVNQNTRWKEVKKVSLRTGHDTLTIAGTGSGKTLPFVMPAFVLERAIIWILVPLNYIQEQQAKDFEGMGLSAVCVNQNTRWKEVKKDILCGKYQVVTSSPEAFLDVDKLWGTILLEELADYRHFVVVDEAHVIQTWGGEFRVAYARVGDLRAALHGPKLADYRHFVVVDEAHVIQTWGGEFRVTYSRVGDLRAALHGVPFSPATATATEEIKNAIITSLHLGAYRPLRVTNRGNFRPNIEHSVHRMTGGAESYKEITHLFPDPTNIKKTIVFVDNVEQAKYIVDELRQHLNLTGHDRYRVCAYFSNRAESGKTEAAEAFKAGQCDILVTTEALTMLMGRGARRPNIRCQAIMMVTAGDYERAVGLCGGGRVREGKPDDFLDPKREEDELLGDVEVQEGIETMEEETEGTTYKKNPKSRRFGLDVARFITAENCYVKILDEVFRIPEHTSCYEAGTCSLCAARRIRDESAGSIDIQALDRAIKREQVDHALAAEGEGTNKIVGVYHLQLTSGAQDRR
ncbi:hypothetical protein RSAG8_09831, partial [Rhizoctonia solani AG-8 WAC10335]